MSNHDDSISFGVDSGKLGHDEGGRMRIEISGRFVGEDDFGTGDDGTGDSGALLLTARELGGEIIFFFF